MRLTVHGDTLRGGATAFTDYIVPGAQSRKSEIVAWRVPYESALPDPSPKLTWKELLVLSDSEIGALWAYLRTAPAKPYGAR